MNAPDPFDVPWSEADSRRFIAVGQIHIPARDQIRDTILDLIPADTDAPFLAVELGLGGGWLAAAILERFPRARVRGFDASPTMLAQAETTLRDFTSRHELRRFRLEDRSWLDDVGNDVRCFVSCLVIHHLDAPAKRTLYRGV